MTFLASLLSAATLFVPLFFPGLAFEGARPLALVALPWLALAPLARGGALHLAFGAPTLGLAFGVEWAQGFERTNLILFGAVLLAWGTLLPGVFHPTRPTETGPQTTGFGWPALVWAGAAALAALPALVHGGGSEPSAVSLAAGQHPLVFVWRAAAGGSPELAHLGTASAIVLGFALVHRRVRARSEGQAEAGSA